MFAMPWWKRLVAQLYFQATYPGRRIYNQCLSVAGRAPIAILVFHRVADDAANEWTTSASDFHAAIGWLERHCDLISLAEVQRRLRAGFNSRISACITFDDGYAENCDVALPLLIQKKIPCTYFVTAQPVLERTPFPHDVRLGRPLAMNTPEQLRDLARCGIEIGAHTRTHPNLAQIADPHRLADEITQARDDLQAAIGAPIRYFAFPFGKHEQMSTQAFDVARTAGYEAVCSAYGGFCYPGDDPFHLQRRCVDGAAVRAQNSAMPDPFRRKRVERFEYAAV